MYNSGNSLIFSIPARKQWFVVLFFPVWLTFWTFGGIAAIAALLTSPNLFILVWLCGWLFGEAFALFTILWMLGGKENIDVASQSIIVRYQLFGMNYSKEYATEYIHDLRVQPMTYPSTWGSRTRTSNVWGFNNGVIVFDYGSKTIRIAGGIDEAEGKQILATIVQAYPNYGTGNTNAPTGL
jgi:hypothetical protein